MKNQLSALPARLTNALEIGGNSKFIKSNYPIHQIFIHGMGEAGIGADIVADILRDECSLPIIKGNDYHIPAFVNKYTLAIVCSSSGDTEEVVFAFEQLIEQGAKIVVIAPGGRLITCAIEFELDYLILPEICQTAGNGIIYFVVLPLFILHQVGIIASTKINFFYTAITVLEKSQHLIKENAQAIARFLSQKIPVIYITNKMKGVALWMKHQLNVKSNKLCWYNVLPEINHNELAGWNAGNEQFAVLYLRNKNDYYRNQVSIDINKRIISVRTPHIMQVFSLGNSIVEQVLYFLYLIDYVTFSLSRLDGIDEEETKVTDYLKKELDEVHLSLFKKK